MEHNNKTAWTSYKYIQELNRFRPLTIGEELWLNTFEQTGWMCVMCDSTFATEYEVRNHLAKERPLCQNLWTWKRRKFLDEMKGFRPLSTEEHEWLKKFGPIITCKVCDKKFEMTSLLKRHIKLNH